VILTLARKALGALLGAGPALPIICVVSLLFVAVAGWGAVQQKKYHHALSERDAALQSVENLTAGIERANADAASHKALVEANQRLITHDEDNDIRGKLAAALERLRNTKASAGGRIAVAVPEATKPSVNPAGAGQAPLVDDAVCAEAVIKAEGWQSWYTKIESDAAGHQPADEDHVLP